MGKIQLCFKGNLATSVQDMAGECVQEFHGKEQLLYQ